MAEKITSADVIAINTSEEIVGIILEASRKVPELGFFAASPVDKTYFKTMVRTALPTAGFRAIGSGRARDKGTLEQRIVACSYLDASWDEDEAAFTGVDWGNLELEFQGSHLLAAMKSLQRQIYDGVTYDAGGFPGLKSLFVNTDSDGVVDAGGTTAATASSIYLVKTGLGAQAPDEARDDGIALVWGNQGEIAAGDIYPALLYDGDGLKYNGRAQKVEGWAGLQIVNHKAAVRIVNVTEDAGHTCDDDILDDAVTLFAERYGEIPDGILMSYRSRRQLQKSRMAVNTVGLAAPTPTDHDGIQVIPTLGITKTEALVVHS